jgi:hypothetical protein
LSPKFCLADVAACVAIAIVPDRTSGDALTGGGVRPAVTRTR